MKIIPVASGKGGVGKTTLALNLALCLSRQYQTVLVDLDAGTSSLRNFLEMPVARDIYHFLKKNTPMEKCVFSLNQSLDPEHLFSGFRLIASPKNFISEIVNLNVQLKERLIRGINGLQADFVVLDLKAGLDSHVLDFLPIHNTGILVFTPQVKAATSTAAEMVRAILFRVCRILLNKKASWMAGRDFLKEKDLSIINLIVDRLEDSSNRRVQNFDDFFLQLESRFSESGILPRLKQWVNNFQAYFVLNQFNGVEESAENIVIPFVEKINSLVSSKIKITNLGWVVYDKEIRDSGEYGLPYLIMKHYRRKFQISKSEQLDIELRAQIGLERKEKKEIPVPVSKNDGITFQLDLLNKMYVRGSSRDPEANFDFIAARMKALGSSSIHHCGMRRILNPREIQQIFSQKLG